MRRPKPPTSWSFLSGRISLCPGGRCNYLAALLQIAFDNVGKWAIDKGIPFTNFRNLSGLPKVNELIKFEVDEVNQQFARVENNRRFRLLTKELDHDDDEMTATMKVRRANIYKKFAAEIDAVYQ